MTPATSNSGVPNALDAPMSVFIDSLVDSTAEVRASENAPLLTAHPQQPSPRAMVNVPRPQTTNPEDDAVKPVLIKQGDEIDGLRRSTRERKTVRHPEDEGTITRLTFLEK